MVKNNKIYCLQEKLDELYNLYNKKEYIDPDPLVFLYDYNNPYDREIVGLIASSLAYGNVKQIMKSVSKVLKTLHCKPHDFILNTTTNELRKLFKGFKHRFTTEEEIVELFMSIKKILIEYKSLQNCFLNFYNENDPSIYNALNKFSLELRQGDLKSRNSLIPSPEKASSFKRLNLFLRWMVRSDNVDPGGWDTKLKSKLIIPLDTHIYNISYKIGLTQRRSADIKTAIEITDKFKEISPDDPVKYDFVISRFGIRNDFDITDFINDCRTLYNA